MPEIGNSIKKFFSKRLVIVISILILVLIIAGKIFVPRILKAAAKSSKLTERTTVVRKGNISETVSGSGTLASSNQASIISKADTTVSKVYYKAGQRVKIGDLLMELDSTNAQSTVENDRNNVEQQQVAVESSQQDIYSLSVTAPFNGMVSGIKVQKNDTIPANGTILTIADPSEFKATFQFAGAGKVKVGSSATLYLEELMDTVDGTVTYVNSEPYSTSSGGEVYDVEIEVKNPGALSEGMNATAEIGTLQSTGSSTMEYVNESTLTCSGGGTVTAVNVRNNQSVKKGELLVKVENKQLTINKQAADIKMNSLTNQLNDSEKQLNNYKICSPIDGIIVTDAPSSGDSVKSGDTLVTVVDDKSLEFQISIDELDIEKIAVGQKVDVTLDAVSETSSKPLTGVVSSIAIEGTASNGVTTYPVTVKLNGTSDKLKIGMNADAEIYIENEENVLYVPIEAIQKYGGKSYVMVKGDAKTIAEMKKNGTYIDIFSRSSGSMNNYNRSNGSGSSSTGSGNSTRSGSSAKSGSSSLSSRLTELKGYYANAIPMLVETGISNETYIEIKSGVSEGETILLPPITTSSSTNTSSSSQGIGGIGGMGSEMGGGMEGTFRNNSNGTYNRNSRSTTTGNSRNN